MYSTVSISVEDLLGQFSKDARITIFMSWNDLCRLPDIFVISHDANDL